MWLARSEVADVYLCGSTVALRRGTDVSVESLSDRPWEDVLRELAGDTRGQRWRVWLGGRLCQLRVVDAVPGVRTIEEAEAMVGGLASGPGRACEARLATWSRRGSWVGCCTPAGLAGSIEALAAQCRVSLAGIQPWWARVPAGRTGSVVCCDTEAMTSWHTDDRGRVRGGSTLLLDPVRQAPALQRLRVAGPLEAYLLNLEAPPQRQMAGFAVVPVDDIAHAAA